MDNKDYIEVGTVTPMVQFSKLLAETKQEFVRAFKPYDEPCARLDFRDKLESAERECERKKGFIDLKEIKLEYGDLKRYGNEDRFELVEDKAEPDFVITNGIRTSAITGHTLSYKCKSRGHGISVYIPMKEYEEMMSKKSK